jgi:AcrR family transcriptional regulator
MARKMELGQRTNLPEGGAAQRILAHARRAFNERGVNQVGIREIARELDLSPGNVSYHFPTKEALITALIEEGHAANNAPFAAASAGELDFAGLSRILRAIMQRDLDNVWLMRDAVGLLYALPALRPRHLQMQRAREARVDTMVEHLTAAGLLDRTRTRPGLPWLRQQILTMVFFWVPAAIAAAPDRDPAERLEEHARATLALFLPYCTPAGRRKLDRLLRT